MHSILYITMLQNVQITLVRNVMILIVKKNESITHEKTMPM